MSYRSVVHATLLRLDDEVHNPIFKDLRWVRKSTGTDAAVGSEVLMGPRNLLGAVPVANDLTSGAERLTSGTGARVAVLLQPNVKLADLSPKEVITVVEPLSQVTPANELKEGFVHDH